MRTINMATAELLLNRDRRTVLRWADSGAIPKPHKNEKGFWVWDHAEFMQSLIS